MKAWIPLLLLLVSCDSPPSEGDSPGEKISRQSQDVAIILPLVEAQERPLYPWESSSSHDHPKITKDFLRCKGNSLNPPLYIENPDGEQVPLRDCGGRSEHGLPFHDGQEFVYPVLCDLLNWIQEKTGKKVIVTCGHRCPKHNTYAENTAYNRTSKHLIGAEVDFYVEGMEEQPLDIVKLITDFYAEDPSLSTFNRYTKPDTNVSTPPWHNKEIFLKLFLKDEGRDFDNRHPYPYLGIQVRWDREKDERVLYTWAKANRDYLRR